MGTTDGLSEASCGVYTDFYEAFKKIFEALIQLSSSCYTLGQDGLGESVQILKYFALGPITQKHIQYSWPQPIRAVYINNETSNDKILALGT
jgi:hypothetical protein